MRNISKHTDDLVPNVNDLKSYWKKLREEKNNSFTNTEEKKKQKKHVSNRDLAIVGMGVSLGKLHNLSTFECGLFDGVSTISDVYKTTGTPLALKAFEEAILDTNLDFLDPQSLKKISVILTLDSTTIHQDNWTKELLSSSLEKVLTRTGLDTSILDLDKLIHNGTTVFSKVWITQLFKDVLQLIAFQVASKWGFEGPILCEFDSQNTTNEAIEIANTLLLEKEADKVFIGSISEAPSAILLMQSEEAKNKNIRRYAILKDTNTIDYQVPFDLVQVSGNRNSKFIDVELSTIAQKTKSSAIITSEECLGEAGTVSPMIGIISTALAIHHRYIPTTGKEHPLIAEKIQDVFKGTLCYRPQFSMPWFKKNKKDRAALLTYTSALGKLDCIELYEADWPKEETLFTRQHSILPLTATDSTVLKEELHTILEKIKNGDLVYEYFKKQCWDTISSGYLGVTASIIAKDIVGLKKELEHLLTHLTTNGAADWKMPSGSCFYTKPSNGNVALVYPGGFTSYPFVANGLLRLFPNQFRQLESQLDDVGDILADHLVFPKSLTTLEGKDFMELETNMLEDVSAITTSISCLGIIYTKVLNEVFGLNHHIAFGYSLGDTTMLYANGVWDINSSSAKLANSSHLFKNTLNGEHDFLREKWQLNKEISKDEIWQAFVLFLDEKSIRKALEAFDKIFITHINSPNEIMVSGFSKQLQTLLERLDCQAIRVPIPYAIHNNTIEELSSDFETLFALPTTAPDSNLSLISAGKHDVYDNYSANNISKLITKGYCNAVNFPKMIAKSIALGTDTFIEAGPGGTCMRWVSDNLSDSKENSFTISQRGKTDVQSLEHLLAKIISLQIPLALDKLSPPIELALEKDDYSVNRSDTQNSPIEKQEIPSWEKMNTHLSKVQEENLFYWDFPYTSSESIQFPEKEKTQSQGVEKIQNVLYTSHKETNTEAVFSQLVAHNSKVFYEKQMHLVHRNHTTFLQTNAVLRDLLFQQVHEIIDDVETNQAPLLKVSQTNLPTKTIAHKNSPPTYARSVKKNKHPGSFIKPILRSHKELLTLQDLHQLCKGEIDSVFGKGWKSYASDDDKLSYELLKLVDLVYLHQRSETSDRYTLKTEKVFRSDELLSLINEIGGNAIRLEQMLLNGAGELLKIFALSTGMHQSFPSVQFILDPPLTTQTNLHCEITPQMSELTYEIEIYETGFLPRPYIKSDIKVYSGALQIIEFDAITLRLVETIGIPIHNRYGESDYFSGRRLVDGTPVVMNEFQVAHSSLGEHFIALGQDFAIYDQKGHVGIRLPNGDFQFVDRVINVIGERNKSDNNAIMEVEYDVPTHVWYVDQNNYPCIPSSLYLEAALQASVFLGFFLGAIQDSETNYSVRNLEGKATFLKDLDVRGKTIRFKSNLLSTQSVHGSILQNFSFSLTVDNILIYQGASLFGYFRKEALENQLGLDNGQTKDFWYVTKAIATDQIKSYDLRNEIGNPLFESTTEAPHYRLGVQQLNLLHHAKLILKGGKYGMGYIYGHKEVQPTDWYFKCHFHQDPVMPGSLGLESMYQALQLFIIVNNIGRHEFTNPRFGLALDIETEWKYRGQILKTDSDMSIEVHIKEIKREASRILVIADGDLFKGNLRCYYLHNFAIAIKENITS